MNIEDRSSKIRSKSRPAHAGRIARSTATKGNARSQQTNSSYKAPSSEATGSAPTPAAHQDRTRAEDTPDAASLETFLLRPSFSDDQSTASAFARQSRHGGPDVDFTSGPVSSANKFSASHARAVSGAETDSARTVSVLQVTIRVVGADGAGKTNFIRNASHTNTGPVLSEAVTYVVDRCLCKVKFIEEALQPSGGPGKAGQPTTAGAGVPKSVNTEGTVLLYDVMDSDSLRGVPELLRSIRALQTPAVMVATNCDNPPSSRDIQPSQVIPKGRSIIPDLRVYESALFSTEGAIAAVRGLLTEIMLAKGLDTHPITRPRSDSAALALSATANEAPSLRPTSSSVTLKTGETGVSSNIGSRSHSRQHSESSQHQQLDGQARESEGQASTNYQRLSALPPGLAPKPHSFLILDDISSDDQDQDQDEVNEESDATPRPSKTPTVPSKYSPATFQELLDMLLRPVPTEEDVDFLHTFLAFYRLFVSPWILLDAIITHFESVEEDAVTPWVHETILDRDLAVVGTWLQQYPGDFVKPLTRSKLHDFLIRVLPEPSTMDGESAGGDSGYFSVEPAPEDDHRVILAHRIATALENVVEDEDTDWACSDRGFGRRRRANTFLSMSSVETVDDRSPAMRWPQNPLQTARINYKHDQQLIFGGSSTLTLNAMFRNERYSSFAQSCSHLVSVAECAQRQACLLVPNSKRPMDKDLWRSVLSQSDESIARELTRIDWILFSAVRPRDMIRHAMPRTSSASDSGSSTPNSILTPSIEHVDRLVNHFIHLTYWVINLILFRDKPKHRATMLAKLIHVAASLRRLNNYNALGAFVAVIDGPQIKHLKATWALIDLDLRKKLESLKILMSPNRSHWAYRFALESTESVGSPRVPYIPLHRRDLIVAERNARTFIPDGKPLDAASTTSSTTLTNSRTQKGKIPSKESSIRTTKSSTSTATTKTNNTKSTTRTTSTKKSSSSTSSTKTITPTTATAPTPASPTDPDCTSCLTPSTLPHRKINWPKFAIMGETLSLLRKAQSCPYTSSEAPYNIPASASTSTHTSAPASTGGTSTATGSNTASASNPTSYQPNTHLSHSTTIQSLLLDVRICKDDDSLWKRSYALEPPMRVEPAYGDDSEDEGGGGPGGGGGAREAVRRRMREGLGRLRVGGRGT